MRFRPKNMLWVLLALAVLICPASWAGEQRLVTDMAGRRVGLPSRVDRVVALGPGCLRLLVYLEACELIKGIEAMEPRYPLGRPYYMAHPELGRLPRVGPGGVAAIGGLPDLEALLAVCPQVVFATHLKPAQADLLAEKCRCPVVVLDYGRFAGFKPEAVAKSLALAGKILGKERRAAEVAAYLRGLLGDLAKRTTGAKPPAPAYVGGIGFKGSQGLESSDAGYQPLAWLGAPNAAGSLSSPRGHVFVGKERLLALNPETIFIDGGGLGMVRADYLRKPGYYHALGAFRRGRVHVLHPYNWYTANLGTVFADAYALGSILYPERFRDVSPAAKADEIYSFLVGAPVHGRMAELYGPLGGVPPFIKDVERKQN